MSSNDIKKIGRSFWLDRREKKKDERTCVTFIRLSFMSEMTAISYTVNGLIRQPLFIWTNPLHPISPPIFQVPFGTPLDCRLFFFSLSLSLSLPLSLPLSVSWLSLTLSVLVSFSPHPPLLLSRTLSRPRPKKLSTFAERTVEEKSVTIQQQQ